ncbi:MAG: HEAT repeat domain-containing protein [Chloroflexota bacterium]|nr:HEAT repeat domain-containing protein [Chloroflexota bacterium]MDE2910171.1 HEAT repeat domain-containing protein [Chloroflexota bacterium]
MPGIDEESAALPFPKPSLNDLIRVLRIESKSDNGIVPSAIVYGLSDLSPEEQRAIEPVWDALPAIAKHRVLRALNEASEAMFELNYRELALRGLEDESSLVRATAIDLLWIDESAETMRKLLRLAEFDADAAVRTRALERLGRFILLGEYGDIAADLAKQAQTLTYGLYQDPAAPVETRRRALEALANSSHPAVADLIRSAYADGNHELRVGAIFAMGRTCSAVWRDQLLDELESGDSECVYEAIRACGQIQLKEAARRIGEFTLSEDHEIQMIAIWSLGEIGGRHAIDVLSSLEENAAADDEMAAAIDEALDTAGFSLSVSSLNFELEDD